MKAKEFWENFKKLFKEGSKSLKKAQKNLENSKNFTKNFVKEYFPVVMRNGKEYETGFEYYRIDIIAYSENVDEAERIEKAIGLNKKKFSPYLWDLEIALEHENDKKEWLDEVIKLSHINCPLRVVIGYATEDSRELRLRFASEMLQKKIGNNTPNGQEFMLILGKSGISGEQVNENTYKAYIYENGEFIEL